jgi:hypothetical protein
MKRFVEGADRGQRALFPECLEDWICERPPARLLANGPAVAYVNEVVIQPMKRSRSGLAIGSPQLDKVPKSKNEIEMVIMAELRDCQDCETAWGVVVVAVECDDDANWTVSQFNRGKASAYACDLALQRIVPHYQRLYELVQKH